MVKLNVNLLRS